ncbi:MAG TPA: hypothetical protein VKY85_01225 [Candidatus Angelobacter sp.]|nr:hypothetical protein [Candidatus Angelobacter sp.]
MNRDDIHGVERCPSDLAAFILRRYGTNPFNEPMWRVELAQNVYCRRAGLRKIWLPNIPVSERGGIIMSGAQRGQTHQHRPWTEVGGVWQRPKYPKAQGWILQRWYPAEMYDQKTWMAPQNMTVWGPKLGPFPVHGDYELALGPFQELPTSSMLDEAIGEFFAMLYNLPENIEVRQRMRVDQAEQAEQDEAKHISAFLDDYMKDKCSYIWSSSLEAGRIREEVAKRCGIREHVGN